LTILPSKIDITNANVVLQYGAQDAAEDGRIFRKMRLKRAHQGHGRSRRHGDGLIGELKNFERAGERQRAFSACLKKSRNRLDCAQCQIQQGRKNIDVIVSSLQAHQVTRLRISPC
jgi:hypothetical protein